MSRQTNQEQPVSASLAVWAVILTMFGAGLSGCAAIDRQYEAALLLSELAAEEDGALARRTPSPHRQEISYEIDGEHYIADLYRPGEGSEARAAFVLTHGFTAYGKDDPRLVAFAEGLARARFNVLVPDVPSLRELQVHPSDRRFIAAAVLFLHEHAELVPEGRIGVGAFSYAVGPMILAAMEPAVARQLDFTVAIGGYYDVEDAIRFLTTGYHDLGPERVWAQPQQVAKWSFLGSYLYRIEHPQDRALLEEMVRRRQHDPDADIDSLAAELEAEGRTIYNLLTNRDPDQVSVLLAALPEDIQAEISALDLANERLDRFQPALLLIHGSDDPIIPATHSRALAAEVREGELYVVGGLNHVDIDLRLRDRWRLWRATVALLRLRDGV
ncbi:hypothetical protein CAI21_19645 [Alkalilimnicola ehrlichii]|uniref:Alpha/beta hydrolase n=1 Tax=Alkalilimnicola ehrlichii TaxID=351052 RepID=A0A3E0WK23_9GAMM|nr:alpha/beta hydrolase [Alkalilimnicola ehrlichii]RFA25186.1 hypothetical protein CAI21_19645 [Alkalilimnicola ehrlichii]RFA32265.1 hypothetical protein CAL65_20065 [Alkalilimnicola ehrlichii]